MCMPRYFGKKTVDGKVIEKKKENAKNEKKNVKSKNINQASVEFEDEDTDKRD
ncbi:MULTISPECIES: hypothetical protein [unclassified Lebetimonas]|uniref:hypothetical protein n=1 Tax=unclassified Lebetimonas TaxID=2648158 RepID=UPI0004BABD3D|nr:MULTISPECIES: hypothetical protein [unclassified Lebetimonas]